jgi:protein phosphatase PTC1
MDKDKGQLVRKLFTANVGDARVVINRGGKAFRLSHDHKASDREEAKRITDSGGFVAYNRVNGILSVTRALGDHAMKEWVVCDPHYSEIVLNDKDQYLILACDGIWDVLTDQDAVDLIKDETSAQAMCEKLLKTALSKGSTDNISVMVLIF